MEIQKDKEFTIIGMDAYVTKEAVPGITAKVDPLVEEGAKGFVLDMFEVKTLNSSMASVIVHLIKQTTGARNTRASVVYVDAIFGYVEPDSREMWICVAQPTTAQPAFVSPGWQQQP